MIPHSKPSIGPEEERAVLKVLRSGYLAQGPQVEAFEKDFCPLTGRRYAVAVNSGSSALMLALVAAGVKSGDEVIVPSYNCAALLHPIQTLGAKPVLADIDLDDYGLCAADVQKKMTKKTKAIVPAHLFGRAGRMKKLLGLEIPVIEDGTQALGSTCEGKPVGSFGVAGVFSFYATKMITTGEGGMIVTDSAAIAKRLLDLREYDKKETYAFRTNSKMTDFQAAMGREQLKKLPWFIEARRAIATLYQQELQDLSTVSLPAADPERPHVYFRYVFRVPQKASALIQQLSEKRIDAKRPVFKPLHRFLGFPDRLFPASAQAFRECVSLPIFPEMKISDSRFVSRELSRFFSKASKRTVCLGEPACA